MLRHPLSTTLCFLAYVPRVLSTTCGSVAANYQVQCCGEADERTVYISFANATTFVSEPTDLTGSGLVAKRLLTSPAAQAMGLGDVHYPGGFPAIIPKFAGVTSGETPLVEMALVYLPFLSFVGIPSPVPSAAYSSGFLFLDKSGDSPEPPGDHIADLYELPESTPENFLPGPLLTFYQNKLNERADALEEDRILLFPVARNPASGMGFSTREIEVEADGTLDLSWMKARAGGDFGSFLKRFNATQVGGIGGPSIVSKFADGTINFAEFNGPFLNENVGLNDQSYAPFYYKDNIQEYTSLYFAFINSKWWNAISEDKKRAFHVERRARLIEGYQEALTANEQIIAGLEARGVQVRTLSEAALTAMRTEWAAYVSDRKNPAHTSYDADWETIYNIIYS